MTTGIIVKDMRSTEYLYGMSAGYLEHLTYIGALKFKIENGKELLNKLLNEQLKLENVSVETWFLLEERINKVVDAIHHNKFLLKEVEDDS